MRILLTCVGLLLAAPAIADIQVDFDEGAPKDRFTISNTGTCAVGPLRMSVDISTAPSGLIFDVTEQGAGVEVFQPFELVVGRAFLETEPSVADGQQSVDLEVTGLPIDQAIAFTIDVDDTTSDRQITVSGSEIAGAQVTIAMSGETYVGTFGSDARAIVDLSDCAS